ncbi:MAG: hypothetical protein CM1200mP18_04180 [Gammaproteobacteria bacterium]|nr:MAG: hypothetical protein CM1200mP18_04180 [Gammaproteobacteria bacterium]
MVTGSGSGIGAAVVKRLAQPGTRVLIHAKTKPKKAVNKLQRALKAAGGDAAIMLGDLFPKPDTGSKLINHVVELSALWIFL